MTETSGRPRRHGGALLADLLIEHGVRHVFGVPGVRRCALRRHPGPCSGCSTCSPGTSGPLPTPPTATHGTRQAGVCDATVGPGAAKLPSGLAEALGASVPVIALVSDLPARLAPHRYRSAASQALDQSALLAPVTKWHATVADPETMPALVRQAFREATTGGPGPVALFLPQDILDGPAAETAGETALGGPPGTSARFGGFPCSGPRPRRPT